MGRRRKTEGQVESDKKGEVRMRRYEEKQENEVPKVEKRTVTFWEKIGENGDWEKKEYIVTKAKV